MILVKYYLKMGFIKFRHSGSNYKMCGYQISFNYNDFNERLNKLLDKYKISIENIVLIHLIFWKNDEI